MYTSKIVQGLTRPNDDCWYIHGIHTCAQHKPYTRNEQPQCHQRRFKHSSHCDPPEPGTCHMICQVQHGTYVTWDPISKKMMDNMMDPISKKMMYHTRQTFFESHPPGDESLSHLIGMIGSNLSHQKALTICPVVSPWTRTWNNFLHFGWCQRQNTPPLMLKCVDTN